VRVAMFPGQGSLKAQIGEAWRADPAAVIFDEISSIAGIDVERLLCEAKADELVQTDNAQLATFAMSSVVAAAARRAGFEADLAVGHSLGEYSALHFAGVLDLASSVALVMARGHAMLQAASLRSGTMAAVLGADREVLVAALAQFDDLVIANENAPGQIVIAGPDEQVEALRGRARELGLRRVMALDVGGAFHSPLMAPAADALDVALAAVRFEAGSVPVISNVDGRPHRGSDEWRGLLQRQLTAPVLFETSIAGVASRAHSFVELGPGEVLCGLVRRIAPTTEVLGVSSPTDLERLKELADA